MRSHNYIRTRKGLVDLEELKACVDLTALYGEGKLRCPWHDDNTTPNLQVYPDHAYCFACGKVVDSVAFVMHFENLNFYDAVAFLEENKGARTARVINDEPVSVDSVREWHMALRDSTGTQAVNYLINRGIDVKVMAQLALGWRPNEITIPHIVNGECVNVKFRNLTENGPKYNSLPGREFKYLYPYDYFRQHHSSASTLFLCEGEFDAMVLLSCDLPAMSVPSGVNTPLDSHIPFLKRFKNVVLLFDQDSAGMAAADRVFVSRMKTGYTVEEACGDTQFYNYGWDALWGKDVTEAREKLLPLLLGDYAKGF